MRNERYARYFGLTAGSRGGTGKVLEFRRDSERAPLAGRFTFYPHQIAKAEALSRALTRHRSKRPNEVLLALRVGLPPEELGADPELPLPNEIRYPDIAITPLRYPDCYDPAKPWLCPWCGTGHAECPEKCSRCGVSLRKWLTEATDRLSRGSSTGRRSQE